MYQKMIVFLATSKIARKFTAKFLRLFSVEIPYTVVIGDGLQLPHGGMGVVIHPSTIIGNRVKIYQQVTIGRSDIWKEPSKDYEGVFVGDDVIICTGAKILTNKKLTIGSGTIVAANCVLTKSTGENEIWAGVPGKMIKKINRNV